MALLGYCCINNTLRNQKQSVYTSRGITRKKFSKELAEQRSLSNVNDLLTILKWNEDHNIKSFRIGSEPLPRSGDRVVGYSISDLSNSDTIMAALKVAGRYAYKHGHVLSFHPGQYVCLGSPNEDVRQLGIYALERENEVADAISKETGIDIPINIHMGSSYGGDFLGTAARFIDSFKSLSPSLQSRIVVENDDKSSGWSVQRLYCMITQYIQIPITFDIHHWYFCNDCSPHSPNDPYVLKSDFLLAKSTWSGRNMQVHYSQSPTKDKLVTKHSDYYRDPIPNFISDDDNCHVHLECKAKELALLKYRMDFSEHSDVKEELLLC